MMGLVLMYPPPVKLLLLVSDAFGMYDTGLPLVAINFWISVPKATVLVTLSCVVAGKVGLEPEGIAVVRVLVTLYFDVDWSEAGQFTSPVDKHTVAVYVTVVVVVFVVRSALGANVAAAVVVAVELTFPETAQASKMVVYQIGVWKVGFGPHVCWSIAIVAYQSLLS